MKHLLTCLVFALLSLSAQAQCTAENTAFKAGESLTYDLYFNWKFVWVKCGTAFYKMSSTTFNGKKAIRNDLRSSTNKKCDAFFVMRDTLSGIFTPDLVPLYYRKGAMEGKRYTVEEAWYTYPKGKNNLKLRYRNRHGNVTENTFTPKECTYDMVSMLALARSFDPKDYKKGQRLHFPMVAGRDIEDQTLIYKGRKELKANDGNTYRCLVFSLLDYEEKDKEKELLQFFITDDLNHLPVRIDFNLRFGSAKAYLTKSEGLRNKVTSIIK